ncbi:MAG TPA: 50S ribosomal protein L31 [Planctomycetes bacterium]|nr:50S ribosomal protein L31 [Planctomycetota bacterium]
MKKDIHPKYEECEVTCACGVSFKTRSSVKAIKVDICSECHPFYTGKQKFVDTAGRVDKFMKRYGKHLEKKDEKTES